ncbi:MAG: hypothetical protein AAGB12_06150 [Pseudomonadota bacterium]
MKWLTLLFLVDLAYADNEQWLYQYRNDDGVYVITEEKPPAEIKYKRLLKPKAESQEDIRRNTLRAQKELEALLDFIKQSEKELEALPSDSLNKTLATQTDTRTPKCRKLSANIVHLLKLQQKSGSAEQDKLEKELMQRQQAYQINC